jgi:hypothetical protein
MLKKNFRVFAVVLLMAGLIGAAAPVRASAGLTNLSVRLAPGTFLDHVMFSESGDVEFYGHSSEAEGACLPAQIFVDGERASWWPVYTCAKVNTGGEWFLRVPSEDGGQPVKVFFNLTK